MVICKIRFQPVDRFAGSGVSCEICFQPYERRSRGTVAQNQIGVWQPGVALLNIPEGDTRHMGIHPENRELGFHLLQLLLIALPVQIKFADVDGEVEPAKPLQISSKIEVLLCSRKWAWQPTPSIRCRASSNWISLIFRRVVLGLPRI